MLFEQLLAASFLDWLAMLTSLAYVWLAARDNNWCWGFAAVSTAVWAYQSFVVYQLVSDALLQVFYFIMAGVGIWRWRANKRAAGTAPRVTADGPLDELLLPTNRPSIKRMSWREHALTISGGLLGGLFLGHAVGSGFTAAATYPDAITTVFSIITTFLLIARRLENWLYWVVIDLAYVGIYWSSGAILFALMMVINIGMAIYGYRYWRRELAA